jgi:AGZA family xanthine/uracil permease-like MFS transporter
MNILNQYFGVQEAGSTVRRELLGGLTTFATMSYIIFVQPTVLSMAGMDFGSVLIATCLSAAIGCMLMGFIARYPFALAPGMGENFLFVFTVCLGMKFSWQAGLAIVLCSGLLFLLLSLFRFREKIMDMLPSCLKNAIGPAIGLLIAFVGLQWSGIIMRDPVTMVSLGNLSHGAPLVVMTGVLLSATLLARKVPGALLIGILCTAGLGVITGVIPREGAPMEYSLSTVGQLNFGELLSRWQEALLAIILFFFLDLFDTVGSLVGVGVQAGFIKEDGKLPRAGQAFFSDALATCSGALLGTSTVTTYIESASGVVAGARTGLAAVVTGLCFIAAIGLAPIVAVVGQDIGPAYYGSAGVSTLPVPAMHPAVAPALIIVGFMMLAPLKRINWNDITEGLPAFLTMIMMPFGFGITEGVAAGCISFTVLKTSSGRWREVHPLMYCIAAALVGRYVFLM